MDSIEKLNKDLNDAVAAMEALDKEAILFTQWIFKSNKGVEDGQGAECKTVSRTSD